MSQESVERQLREAPWFQRLGTFVAGDDTVAMTSLEPWASVDVHCSEAELRVVERMSWLPQSRAERDPVHGQALEHVVSAEQRQAEATELALRFYRVALTSLKAAQPNRLLEPNGKSFAEAAQRAALHAARRAAVEVLVGQEGFWSRAVKLYARRHWPCGLLPDMSLVVF